MELRGALQPGIPLVVVAVHLEAEHVHTRLPVLVTGIGKVATGRSIWSLLARLPPKERPSALLNLGTAGALREGIEGTHVIGSTFQHDLDGDAIAKLTGINPAPRLIMGPGPVLATGDQFVDSAVQRESLAKRADLVDMEGYAVADAAHGLGLPVALIKHVSDDADEGAVKSWIESVAECSEILGEWLKISEASLLVGHVQRVED